MRKLNVKNVLEVNANASEAWELIGPKFLDISEWARGVRKSWNNESAQGSYVDAPAGGRYCEVSGFGVIDERITHFDSSKHEISWSATASKLPSFVSGLQNTVTVEQVDEDTCRITSNITADLSGLRGALFGSVVEKNFSKTVDGFLNDWKTYTETGQVSATKQRELAVK